MKEVDMKWNVYNEKCPTRLVLDRIADKWTVLIVVALDGNTMRFGELRREIGGVSQKMLTQTLRGLERDGLVARMVYASVPPKVEYSLTELGRTLVHIFESIRSWAENNIEDVLKAQSLYATQTVSEPSDKY
jgi:DNA-binding HxlR family transcriptional regulator